MNQPITSLFTSQSTKGEKSIPEKDHDEDDVMLHASKFEYEVQKLRDVAKEHHILFFEEVKKVEESVNQKVEVLKCEMLKEVAKIEQNYLTLHVKINVVVEAIKKLVEYYTSFTTKFDTQIDVDSKVFAKLEEFVGSLKESISKLDTSHTSFVTQGSLSNMFSSLETYLKVELAPFLKLVNLMPSNAQPFKPVVQGGDKGVGSSKDHDQGNIAGKGSSSKPPPLKQYKGDRGKGIEKGISEEEKKKNSEKENER
ncbi:unnamed protein product [Lactuca saligna]|uniref:Uncharacterized protein n=1 Tax=Lactuca saligna TaxID=75948 RepID=A0AA36EFI9_LACSI|nr:unnamed protein product [Lactuca saligna]